MLSLLKKEYSNLPTDMVDLIFSEKWSVILLTRYVCTSGMRMINESIIGSAMRIPMNIMKYLNDFLIFLTIIFGKKSSIKIT
jgi:hypothetical protein